MNEYSELKSRQQKEFNKLPLGFAFNNEQFFEMMNNWKLDPINDTDKIHPIGSGGYIQKKDLTLFNSMTYKHEAELDAAIEKDTTGDDFVYQMFLNELYNYEYNYTDEIDDVLDTLGFTYEEILKNRKLLRGFYKAIEYLEHLKNG